MTVDTRELAERLADHEVKRGAAAARPKSKALADMLATITVASKPNRLYPSARNVEGFRIRPATLTDERHEALCSGGRIAILTETGMVDDLPCPRCAAERAERRLRAQLQASGVDGRYLDSEWDSLELVGPIKRVSDACEKIAEIIEKGESLLLYSQGTGTGKTQSAMMTAKAAVRAGYTACVCNVARLAVDVRDSYSVKDGSGLTEGAARGQMATPDLLVIDDLGAGQSDSAAVERRLLYQALDERQQHARPTVVTTNLRPDELAQELGGRVLARLQPLTVLNFDHGVNFRTRSKAAPLW